MSVVRWLGFMASLVVLSSAGYSEVNTLLIALLAT